MSKEEVWLEIYKATRPSTETAEGAIVQTNKAFDAFAEKVGWKSAPKS